MIFHTTARARVALVLVASLALASLFATGCGLAASLGLIAQPSATATPTPTSTATPTSTTTPTPTSTPTPTAEPLRLAVSFDPPQVKQGHTLLLKVLSNRAVTVTGTFDERRLPFVPQPGGAWAVAGVPVVAQAGGHPIQLAITDALGASVSTTVSILVLAADFGTEHIQIPADRVSLLDPELSQEEAQRLEQVFAAVTAQQLWQGAFVPAYSGQVSSPFGMSRTYNDGANGYHAGVDLSGAEGDVVVASNRGRVALAATLKVHGNTVILDHGWGVYSAYYHLSQILVSEGQQVAQGEDIGLVGNTGLSTGAHLHWEMRIRGVPVDPTEWTGRTIPG